MLLFGTAFLHRSNLWTRYFLRGPCTFQIQYRHRAQPLELSLTAYPLTSLITLLICMLMLVTGINVGRARGRYGIKAPAVTGHEMFERAYRIQMNTLENAALMLPALWVNAGFISDRGAAAVGALWLISRIWYAIAYQATPPSAVRHAACRRLHLPSPGVLLPGVLHECSCTDAFHRIRALPARLLSGVCMDVCPERHPSATA